VQRRTRPRTLERWMQQYDTCQTPDRTDSLASAAARCRVRATVS
jgi:hypothetical protein